MLVCETEVVAAARVGAKECQFPSAAASCEVKFPAVLPPVIAPLGLPPAFIALECPTAPLLPENPCQPGEVFRAAPWPPSHDHGLEDVVPRPEYAPLNPPLPA